jgi:hypothetical protein
LPYVSVDHFLFSLRTQHAMVCLVICYYTSYYHQLSPNIFISFKAKRFAFKNIK